MPFVTEEIFKNLSKTPLIISEYPKYDKNLLFVEGEAKCNALIEFVRIFRNRKAELQIGKEYRIYISKPNDYSLIRKLLKWEDKETEEKLSLNYTVVEYQDYQVYLYNEHKETLEDQEKKLKTIDSLKKSILKRENLLKNQNFIEKAPENLVNEEKRKLSEEKEMLKKYEEE